MAFTTSGQETEWALFLQSRSSHVINNYTTYTVVNGAMIGVGYLQCQVNVIINKYATYTEKTLKSWTDTIIEGTILLSQ